MKHTTAATTRRALASLQSRQRKRETATALTDLYALMQTTRKQLQPQTKDNK